MADEPAFTSANLTAPAPGKPSFLEWVETFLPFTIPRISLPQTAKNLDKALARLVDAGGSYYAASIDQAKRVEEAQTAAQIDLIKRGTREIGKGIAAGNEGLIERSIKAVIGEHIRSQRNREAIAEAAARELQHEPPTSDASKAIDDDWLNLFATLAAGKSNADMQSLWGKLLAGEIRQPGTFRLRTLQALSVLDAEEAQLIHKHMSLVVGRQMLFHGGEQNLIGYPTLLDLQALGVIQEVGGNSYLRVPIGARVPGVVWLGENALLQIDSDQADQGRILEVCPLTPFGEDLYRLAKPDRCAEGVAELVAAQLRSNGRRITLLEFGPRDGSGGRSVHHQKDMSNAPEATSSSAV